MRWRWVPVVAGVVLAAASMAPLRASGAQAHGISLGSLPSVPAFDGQPCGHPATADPTCPVWNRCSRLHSCTGDAPDPAIVKAGDLYLAVTTGTALGNDLQVLVSDSPTSGFHGFATFSCDVGDQVVQCPQRFGQTAFGLAGQGLASWAVPGTQTSPALAYLDGSWHLYFDTLTTTSVHSCLAVAVLNPAFAGPGRSVDIPSSSDQPLFVVPAGQVGPLRCSPPPSISASTGLVDPTVVTDPTTSTADLLFKANDGSSAAPGYIVAERLSADGLSLVGPAHVLLGNDDPALGWERTVEDPSMIEVNGAWLLLFSTGLWYRADYAEAVSVCTSPFGPCTQPSSRLLTSYGSVAGPAGGSLFVAAGSLYLAYAGWEQSCVGYSSDLHGTVPRGCTTGARHLFVVPATAW